MHKSFGWLVVWLDKLCTLKASCVTLDVYVHYFLHLLFEYLNQNRRISLAFARPPFLHNSTSSIKNEAPGA